MAPATLYRSASLFALVLLFVYGVPQLAVAQNGKGQKSALLSLQQAFTEIAEEVEPAVVTITANTTVRRGSRPSGGDEGERSPGGRAFRMQGTGSGVIIDNEGWILTNDHVVGGAASVTVKLIDGREFQGRVIRDYRSDLALVKIEGSNLTAARLGDSDRVKIGQWAIAIGSPYRYEGSFSVGVISSLARRQTISERGGGGRFYPNMLQTDAAINPGNSGGPLVNIEGEVVGINTAIESESGGSVGIGFAIPINSAKFVIEQLRSHGRVRYGYLGINPNTITPRLAALYRVNHGALVTDEPSPDSPAAKAGIQVEDVITSINEKPVRNELDLRTIVSRISPGTSVRIAYVRDGEEKTVRVTLDEMPAAEPPRPPIEPGPVGLGIEVAAITPEAAKRVGLAEAAEGVVVSAIKDASVAEDTLLKGDVILQINSTKTPNVEAFEKAVKNLKPGDSVRVRHAGRRFGQTIKRVAILQLD